MSTPILQIASVAIVAIYLVRWRSALSRRNSQSWDALFARLTPGWTASALSDHFLSMEGLNSTPDETWEQIQGARGLRAMYRNAGVILEMADYAARNCESADLELLAALRSDATQIRVAVLKALAQFAFEKASESVRLNAFHVASMYTVMAARMARLLQASAPDMLPDFVAAM